MKILLIGINSKYIHPSMGLHQILTNSNYPSCLKEFTIKDNITKIIEYVNNYIVKYQKDVLIGFSCYIWNIELIKKILPSLASQNILLGGPEASYNYIDLLTNYNVKYIISGEGEESFNELLDYLNGNNSIDNVSNLFYKDIDIKFTYFKSPNLNNVNHNLSLINDYENKVCYIESSRGCYFNCTYCLASLEKPVRFFDLSEVFSNIKFLLDRRAKIIKFLDRSFNVNNKFAYLIIKFLKENDNNYSKVQLEVVGDMLSDELIELLLSMRKGYIRLEIGIQTLNNKTLKAINRNQNFDLLKSNIIKLLPNTTIHTDLIAGLPFEDYNSFINTFNETFLLFSNELQLGFLKELKGTVISKTKDDYDYVFSNEAPYEVISNKYISNEDIQKIKTVEKALDKFYNSNVLTRTMKYLFKTLSLNPFNTFLMLNIDYSLSFSELIKRFYEIISNMNEIINKYELLFIIKQDYLSRNKIKPKIWWDSFIDKKERYNVYQELSKVYNIDINTLYNYAKVEKYNDDCYQYYYCYCYKNEQEYFLKRSK